MISAFTAASSDIKLVRATMQKVNTVNELYEFKGRTFVVH